VRLQSQPREARQPREAAAGTKTSRDERDAALRTELDQLRRENQALRSRLATTIGERRSLGRQLHP